MSKLVLFKQIFFLCKMCGASNIEIEITLIITMTTAVVEDSWFFCSFSACRSCIRTWNYQCSSGEWEGVVRVTNGVSRATHLSIWHMSCICETHTPPPDIHSASYSAVSDYHRTPTGMFDIESGNTYICRGCSRQGCTIWLSSSI